GVKQAGHILGRDRTVGHAAVRRFDFDHGLQPVQAARTVAHELDLLTALFGFGNDGRGGLLGAHGFGGGIQGNVNTDCHCALLSSAITSSKRSLLTLPTMSSLTRIEGDRAQLPRQYTASRLIWPS